MHLKIRRRRKTNLKLKRTQKLVDRTHDLHVAKVRYCSGTSNYLECHTLPLHHVAMMSDCTNKFEVIKLQFMRRRDSNSRSLSSKRTSSPTTLAPPRQALLYCLLLRPLLWRKRLTKARFHYIKLFSCFLSFYQNLDLHSYQTLLGAHFRSFHALY